VVELRQDSQRILEFLEERKTASHRAIKAELGLDAEPYAIAKDELIAAGKAVPLRCRGGGLRLSPSGEELPDVDEGEIDKARLAAERTMEAAQKEEERAEKDLYPHVERWAINEGYDSVATTGAARRRSVWENPDLIALTTNELDWHIGTEIEVTTIEVKLAFSIDAIWQAANYRRFSHYVYLACFERPDDIRRKEDGRLYETVVELGLGIISLRAAGAGAKGTSCTEINSPHRQSPKVSEIDRLLDDFHDELGVTPPRDRIAEQIRG